MLGFFGPSPRGAVDGSKTPAFFVGPDPNQWGDIIKAAGVGPIGGAKVPQVAQSLGLKYRIIVSR